MASATGGSVRRRVRDVVSRLLRRRRVRGPRGNSARANARSANRVPLRHAVKYVFTRGPMHATQRRRLTYARLAACHYIIRV